MADELTTQAGTQGTGSPQAGSAATGAAGPSAGASDAGMSGALSGGTPPPASTPSSVGNQAAAGSGATTPSQAAGALTGGAAAAASSRQYTGLLDYAKGLGVDLGPQYQDDAAAFQALLGAYQQQQAFQLYQPHFQQYLQQAPLFQQWLAQQQAQQQQARQPQPPWNPPASHAEVQRLVAAYYERDPQSGQLKPRADAPPSALQKVQDYQAYVQDWDFKVRHNPVEALAPLIQQEAQKLIQQHLGQFSEQQQAGQVVQRHSEWMFAKDPVSKAPLYGPDGRPRLTPEGQSFSGHVLAAEKLGIRGIGDQEAYALKMLQADLLLQKYAAEQGNQAGRQQVIGANRQPNVATAQTPGGQPAVKPPTKGLALAEVLRRALADHPETEFALSN